MDKEEGPYILKLRITINEGAEPSFLDYETDVPTTLAASY